MRKYQTPVTVACVTALLAFTVVHALFGRWVSELMTKGLIFVGLTALGVLGACIASGAFKSKPNYDDVLVRAMQSFAGACLGIVLGVAVLVSFLMSAMGVFQKTG